MLTVIFWTWIVVSVFMYLFLWEDNASEDFSWDEQLTRIGLSLGWPLIVGGALWEFFRWRK